MKKQTGFTIVELLVVIVVIGILAAITIISYSGISQRAVAASLQSDLSNASQQLKVFQAQDDSNDYPTANNCPTPGSTEICLKSSGSNEFTYVPNNTTNPSTFTLTATNDDTDTSYYISDDTAPIAGLPSITCPTGFIVVPGSSTYGTSDFCVMKYEAKNVGGIATSQTSGTLWASITQTQAISNSSAACSGCHLITEAEWMTIAQNVLNQSSNWSGGAVGSGYIYSGHCDGSPGNSLDAGVDNDGYANTGNFEDDSSTSFGMVGDSQRRTLNLSNGEVIWDFAGNVKEWTSGQTTGGQPGVTSGDWGLRSWNGDITNPGSLNPNPAPSSTGITGSESWSSANGIGMVFSNADDTSTEGFLRGGRYDDGFNYTGVLTLDLSYSPDITTNPGIGFRVAK